MSAVEIAVGVPGGARRGAILVLAAGLCWSFTGIFLRLAPHFDPWQFLAWRSLGTACAIAVPNAAEEEDLAPVLVRTLDPMTGRVISPLTAAALCVKPRGQMTARQIAKLVALKSASTEFGAMRRLAMRFQGLLRGGTPEGLDSWLVDARASGIYAMQRFAKTIRWD